MKELDPFTPEGFTLVKTSLVSSSVSLLGVVSSDPSSPSEDFGDPLLSPSVEQPGLSSDNLVETSLLSYWF